MLKEDIYVCVLNRKLAGCIRMEGSRAHLLSGEMLTLMGRLGSSPRPGTVLTATVAHVGLFPVCLLDELEMFRCRSIRWGVRNMRVTLSCNAGASLPPPHALAPSSPGSSRKALQRCGWGWVWAGLFTCRDRLF